MATTAGAYTHADQFAHTQANSDRNLLTNFPADSLANQYELPSGWVATATHSDTYFDSYA